MALTIGICNVRSINKKEDNFGVVGIATSGSVIAILIFSYFIPAQTIILSIDNSSLWQVLLANSIQVLVALMPIFIIFLIFQFTYFKFPIQICFENIKRLFIHRIRTYYIFNWSVVWF